MTEQKDTPFGDNTFAALQWIDSLFHQLKVELHESRREDLTLLRHQQDRQHEEHRSRLEALEQGVQSQSAAIDRMAKTQTRMEATQTRMVEMLEPWETTGRFVALLDRFLGRVGRSWLFRALLALAVVLVALSHGDWKTFHQFIVSWFK